MNAAINTDPRTGAAWQFALPADPPAPFTQTGENELERLKNRLLRESLARVSNTLLIAPLRRAANEAAALAWLEPHPLLVFPMLFEEKSTLARRRAVKQQQVEARSAPIMAAAA